MRLEVILPQARTFAPLVRKESTPGPLEQILAHLVVLARMQAQMASQFARFAPKVHIRILAKLRAPVVLREPMRQRQVPPLVITALRGKQVAQVPHFALTAL